MGMGTPPGIPARSERFLVLDGALYLAALVCGFVAGRIVNLLADRVSGLEEPPWRADTCRDCAKPLPRAVSLPFLPHYWRRRTCASCGRRASLRYPLLEVTLALSFPLLLVHLGAAENAAHIPTWTVFLLDALAFTVLAYVFAVDLEHHLIYYVSIYPLGGAAFLLAAVADRGALLPMAIGALLLGGLFLLFYVLGFLIYRQEALGFGDVLLAALVGALVGWPAATTALLLTVVSSAAISLLLLGLGLASRKSFIPFGIFLVIGAAVSLLTTHPVW